MKHFQFAFWTPEARKQTTLEFFNQKVADNEYNFSDYSLIIIHIGTVNFLKLLKEIENETVEEFITVDEIFKKILIFMKNLENKSTRILSYL